MEITITVCDVCRSSKRPITRYKIAASDGREAQAELCPEHSSEWEALLPGAPKTRQRRRPKVVTMEEIEALKGKSD